MGIPYKRNILRLICINTKRTVMKRTLLFCLLFTACLPLHSQVVNTESFDGTTFPPNGWTTSGTYGTSTYLFRVTAGTQPTQSPHTGAGEVEYNSYSIVSGVG